MIPPILRFVSENPECVVLFGNRVEPFGFVFDGSVVPYATWQTISGEPFNTLSCEATMERHRIQFDVWHNTQVGLAQAVKVLISAMEGKGYVVSFNQSGRDGPTELYFYSFDAEFLLERA